MAPNHPQTYDMTTEIGILKSDTEPAAARLIVLPVEMTEEIEGVMARRTEVGVMAIRNQKSRARMVMKARAAGLP